MTDPTLQSTDAEPQHHALGTLNAMFHERYAKAVEAQTNRIEQGELILVVRMDDRILFVRGAEIQQYRVTGTHYHTLKALAHIPLIAYYASTQDSRADERLSDLLSQAYASMPMDDELIGQSILDHTEEFLSAVGAAPSFQQVRNFNAALKPLFRNLIQRAAETEVDRLISILTDIDSMLQRNWEDTFLIVCDGHQPRYRQLTKLLFKRWYASRNPGIASTEHHVIYAEGADTLSSVQSLVAHRLADAELSDAFLGSPLSMNQDILGEAAERAIDQAFAIHP